MSVVTTTLDESKEEMKKLKDQLFSTEQKYLQANLHRMTESHRQDLRHYLQLKKQVEEDKIKISSRKEMGC